MIITTTVKPSVLVQQQADRLSAELDVYQMKRGNLSIRKLLERSKDGRALVVNEGELRFYDGDSTAPLFFHPSMAMVRVKRLIQGELDPLLTYSRCEPGDQIIDCTAGLASDSLVFSFAVGQKGSVTALESTLALSLIIREGLAQYCTGIAELDEAMRRIMVRNMEHLTYLKSLADKSVDIVYFDPMFRQPIHESSALAPIRTIVNHQELQLESIEQACRVARKTVIMKEHKDSPEFARLGFVRQHVNTSKIAYGVIEVDGTT